MLIALLLSGIAEGIGLSAMLPLLTITLGDAEGIAGKQTTAAATIVRAIQLSLDWDLGMTVPRCKVESIRLRQITKTIPQAARFAQRTGPLLAHRLQQLAVLPGGPLARQGTGRRRLHDTGRDGNRRRPGHLQRGPGGDRPA